MHCSWCMVDVRLRKGVVVLNLIFDTLQCLIQVCTGLRTNFGPRVHMLRPLWAIHVAEDTVSSDGAVSIVKVAVQYEEGSAPALALKATMERTEKRFKNYGDAGLLCGTDGLPHLISDPGLALRYGHTGETLVCPCATHEFLLGSTHMHIADTGMAVCFD